MKSYLALDSEPRGSVGRASLARCSGATVKVIRRCQTRRQHQTEKADTGLLNNRFPARYDPRYSVRQSQNLRHQGAACST